MAGIFSRYVILRSAGKSFLDMSELERNVARKAMRAVFQQANRRIQNIKTAGIASPAVKAVIGEKGEHKYTYFTVSGLNFADDSDWERALYEYGRARAFLSNPTSLTRGARQYVEYEADRLGITFDGANRIIDLATDPQIDQSGNINIFSYGEILDEYKDAIEQIGDDIDRDSKEYAAELEARIAMLSQMRTTSFLDKFF